jgi:HEAT repeat protein
MSFGVLLLTWLPTAQPGPAPLDVPPFARPARPVAVPAADVVPGLVRALGDVDFGVRQNAAIALAEVGPPALPSLTEALKDRNRDRRAAAAYALGQMGAAARSAVPALVRALDDEDRLVRRQAALAVGRVVARDRDDRAEAGRPIEGPAPAFPAPDRGGR